MDQPQRQFGHSLGRPKGKPLNVIAACSGKHIFELLDEPRAICSQTFGDGPADVVVIPCCKPPRPLTEILTALPHDVLSRIRGGQALAIFDASTEAGPHPPRPDNVIHAAIDHAGLPADRCVYVAQDREYGTVYRANCAAAGRTPMQVAIYDYYIKQMFRAHEKGGEQAFVRRLARFEQRRAARTRRFISLNLRPRPTKVLFLLSLIKLGLWEEGFISFSGMDKSRNFRAISRDGIRAAIAGLDGFAGIGAELLPYLDRLASLGDMVVGEVPRAAGRPELIKPPLFDTPLVEYEQSWFTVVTETEMTGCRRVTEKSFKALLNFHPEIVLGNPGSLELIRSFGFRTFPDYFDETYDTELDPARRFARVCDEVRRLCAASDEELLAREKAVVGTLCFNAHWGLSRLPRVYREIIDRDLIDLLLQLLKRDPTASEA